MLPRLANVLAHSCRGVVSLCYRLFPEKSEGEHAVTAQRSPVLATEQVGERISAPADVHEIPAYAEFVRTQSQIMQTMLQTMIIACGERVDGSPPQNGTKAKR